jgi:hypothetical protein
LEAPGSIATGVRSGAHLKKITPYKLSKISADIAPVQGYTHITLIGNFYTSGQV